MKDVIFAFDVIIALGLLALSFASLLKGGYKQQVNRIFAYLSISVGLWITSNNISNDIRMPNDVALFADYIVFSSSLAFGILMMQMLLKLANAHRFEQIAKKIIWFLRALCVLSFTPLIVNSIQIEGDIYSINFGPLLPAYALGLIFAVFSVGYEVFHGLKYSKGIKRRQLRVISVGIILSIPLVVLFSFVLPVLTGQFYFTEFGITPLIILVVCLYYGVVRYSLFDIRRAIVVTGAYILSLTTLTSIYYLAAYFMSVLVFRDSGVASSLVSPMNVILALLLAFIFQPIKRFFNHVTNSFFYKDDYNTDDFFAKLNKALTITTDLRDLLNRASYEIGNTLKGDQTFFYVRTTNGHSVTAGTSGHSNLPKNDAIKLDEYCSVNNGVVVAALLEGDNEIRRLMLSHRLEIVLPLKRSNIIIGYLCLGEHRNSGYKMRDMKVLTTISDELVIAIQNALSIQEVKDLNENLQMRIDAATKELRANNAQLQRLDKAKDEFVSMASHQLRTPLTSIKGYVSMILDGDVGEINDTMRHMLDEAFMSSERMVNLINDFLNMSRIQTGKFMIEKVSVDLSKVIKQEIDSLQPSAIAHDLSFVYKQPADFPMVNVDEGKIRQVIMNFADNAIYYSKPNTKIDIIVESNKDTISFMVKDHGIGVPESEQANLFTKFFRAANAKKQRPDGTGVGLYLAKRIVDAHDGRIIFESTEGQGSTFGFSIPIKQS